MKKLKEPRSFYAELGREGDVLILIKKSNKEGSLSTTKIGKRKKIILAYPIQTSKPIIHNRSTKENSKRTAPLLKNVTSQVEGVKRDTSDNTGRIFFIETVNSFYKAKFTS
jgi:hypothetical protein